MMTFFSAFDHLLYLAAPNGCVRHMAGGAVDDQIESIAHIRG